MNAVKNYQIFTYIENEDFFRNPILHILNLNPKTINQPPQTKRKH